MRLFSTNFLYGKLFSFFIAVIVSCCSLLSATAQIVTFPSSNPNDSTARQPFGCFHGYERTEALYLGTDIGTNDYITHVAFYLNSVNTPALNTPVVIKMKTTTNTTVSAATYDTATLGATTVWSGNITSTMLVEDNFITITLTTPFNFASNNLEVFVETNYGSFGGEDWDAKGFRQSDTTFNCCQYWENEVTAPTDFGELSTFRPNIQLTFGTLCSGIPNPGNTVSDAVNNMVCSGSLFTLSLQNISGGGGLTYQWQSSTDGNTWTNILNATNATYTTSQTASKYYRNIVLCTSSGQSGTSSALQVTMQSFYHCYCASYATTTEDTKIDSVQLGAISTGSDPFQCESYTDYTAGNIATLTAGQPSTIHIANGSCTGEMDQAYVAVYIDYNHNTLFDATELAYSYGPILSLNSIPDGTFFVPQTASSGTTGMRIVLAEGESIPSACGTYNRGETEDYLVNITAVSQCSGAPDTTSTLSTLSSVCPNEDFTLSLLQYPAASSITYLWQQSTDNINWSSAPAPNTNPTYSDTGQTVNHYYRCKITCTNGGSITYSFSIHVVMNPFYYCYCTSGPTDVLTNDTKIDTLKFGTINAGSDPNHCESYTDNTNLITDVALNNPTPIAIVVGSCDQQFYESYVAVYIDYNHMNGFENDELAYSHIDTSGVNSVFYATITINSAQLGTTGMRVIVAEGDTIPGPCELYTGGETEDYLVNIVNETACIDPPIPGVVVASPSSVCSDALPATISLSLAGNSSGTGQTYQWQDSVSGTWNNLIGQTDPTASATINIGSDTVYYRCQVQCGVHTLASAILMVAVKPTPEGNTLSTAIPITLLPYQDNRNNLSFNCYTINYTGEFAQQSPDVFYSITTPGELGSLTVSTCATTDLNTVIHILGVDTFTNDDNGNMCMSSVEASDSFYVGAPFQTFYIVVQGQGTLEGSYQLNVNFIEGTGVNQIQNSPAEISLLPNPNTGTFNLSFDLGQNISDMASVRITNVIGQVIELDKIAVVNGKLSKEISLSNLADDGLYIIHVQLNDLSMIKRFIIQH